MKKIGFNSTIILVLGLCLIGCSSARHQRIHITAHAIGAPVAQNIVAPRVTYRPLQKVDPAARQNVVKAYEATRQKKWLQLLSYIPLSQADHELGSYPMYWYLREQLKGTIPVAALKQFITANPHTYVAERLKAEWLVRAVEQEDFKTALHLGKVDINHSRAICAYYHTQAETGKLRDSREAISHIKHNSQCWAMVRALKKSGKLSFEQLQFLLRTAVEYGDKLAAQQYADILFSKEDLAQYRAIVKNPEKWIAGQFGKPQHAMQAELRTLAFSWLARQDRDKGIAILQRRGQELLLPNDEQWAYTQFALVAILNLESRAHGWYALGKKVALSDYNAAWRVRAALRQENIDWRGVEKAIALMSPQQQQETAWVYWKARALNALGKVTQAKQLFSSLQHHYDFYGQLAQEELHGVVHLPPQASPVTSQEMAHIKKNAGLQRAIALFRLGWRPQATAEWNYSIKGLSDRELMAAAAWAEQEHVYDRVINTSAQTKQLLSFKQRYVAPYEGRLGSQAQKAGVDPAWVYGLIRQESRFVPVARSRVGASGLMQLMPSTAKIVAKKIGLQGFTLKHINDFDINTVLGTQYLRMTLDKVGGHEVLATVGYNAGPNRAIRWRDSLRQPTEGAIFAETIPFTETRLYVKHVMSNALWYDMRFKKSKALSLKHRLGVIKP